MLLTIVPCLVLFVLGSLVVGVANRFPKQLGWLAAMLCGAQFLAALAAAAWLAGTHQPVVMSGLVDVLGWAAPQSAGLSGVLADIVVDFRASTLIMLGLVSFVSWQIAIFSKRYLDGDPNQGRYFGWLCVTAGAVCLMSVAGSLLLFGLAMALGSLGIHMLLLHFPQRSGARQAAWTKFIFSRLGDAAILICVLALYSQLGSTRFDLLSSDGASSASSAAAVAWLLCIAACLKTAQFPFHTWLPQTVETPTPVSALMHAGVVNAGGYLLIRASSFLAHYPQPLFVLAVVGTTTAVVGGAVMMTQGSIKRSLAYSTVAQMGFMILQCGLGAFSAALLHIVAHSLYKAHAFLSSGSVISESKGQVAWRAAPASSGTGPGNSPNSLIMGVAAGVTVGLFMLTLLVFGVNPAEKAGGWVLCGIICLAFVSGVWRSGEAHSYQGLAVAMASALGLSVVYTSCYLLFEAVLGPLPAVQNSGAVTAGILTAFALLFLLQRLVEQPAYQRAARSRLAGLYVHTANGFYLESFWSRLLGFSRT